MSTSVERIIFSVSQLTEKIKSILEGKFPFIWISGEISNFKSPVSGHYYFTLKDSQAQINAIMFRGQNRNLNFLPENGMKITGFGRISVYQPRGNYQIILEYIEPAGIGALQAGFEQLKSRLTDEGLFDKIYKKPLPYLPSKIYLITSPTGSVVYDMIRVLHRRYSNIEISILPVKVQGNDAVDEIVSAFDLLNTLDDADVAIIARGGGSLEDLSAFNSEKVARAIFASQVPIISAIGHETDFTIADFVSDLRAPTPSAAAELAVPVRNDLLQHQVILFNQLSSRFGRYLQIQSNTLHNLTKRLVHPKRKIEHLTLRLDDVYMRLTRSFKQSIRHKHERLFWWSNRLKKNSPQNRIHFLCLSIIKQNETLLFLTASLIKTKRLTLNELTGRLHALNPLAVIKRGYSITRTVPDQTIISDADSVSEGQLLEILLSKGTIRCRVEPETGDFKPGTGDPKKDKFNGKKENI
ncbi:MAG: exodeoxyribonuclease VII large subunit [Desulfobacteraceae bacterium]|nr:exodeoxyribonuclease VII large subunit [Desulfobacteraceae bacterium]